MATNLTHPAQFPLKEMRKQSTVKDLDGSPTPVGVIRQYWTSSDIFRLIGVFFLEQREVRVLQDADTGRWTLIIKDKHDNDVVLRSCLTRWGARRKAKKLLELDSFAWWRNYHCVYINPPLSFVPGMDDLDDDE